MHDRQADPLGAPDRAMCPAYPINCGLIRNIAWRTLLNRDTVSEREIEALAASVISFIRESELIQAHAEPAVRT